MKNKKLLSKKVLVILGVFLVSAVVVSASLLNYYFLQGMDLSVSNTIDVTGEKTITLDCEAGLECLGNPITITNTGSEDRHVCINVNNSIEEGVFVNLDGTYVNDYDEEGRWEALVFAGSSVVVTPSIETNSYTPSLSNESIELTFTDECQ